MDLQKQTLRFGAAVIAWAVAARLGMSGAYEPVVDWFREPETQSFLVYLETGRKVRFSPSMEELSNPVAEEPAAEGVVLPPETEPEPVLPVFSADLGDLSDILYACSARPDLEALLEQPLTWDLTGSEPKVLILHTHTTESYTKKGEDYKESSAYRTLDENYNMISIGQRLAELLQQAGIGVIHDRQLHDYPSYNGSYNDARKAIQTVLESYPEICLVLDLHRDASGDNQKQFRPVTEVDGQATAQIMLVMGTDTGGLKHPDWQENLSLGLKLQAQLERQAPGITRAMSLRSQRFNQDLTTGSLLIEMGAAGNSHQEALRAAEQLARAIIALAHGTETK